MKGWGPDGKRVERQERETENLLSDAGAVRRGAAVSGIMLSSSS